MNELEKLAKPLADYLRKNRKLRHFCKSSASCQNVRCNDYVLYFKMADTMLFVFHFTISFAARLTASGVFSDPHGSIPMIGFPIDFATSISNFIHLLYAVYIPDMTRTHPTGRIFRTIALATSISFFELVLSRFF